MLRKFSNSRTLDDNLKLGTLTAFSAGMVNIASLMIFFSFSSNVTGHYAILAEEILKGNWYQAGVVFSWIFLFFFGSFVSNMMVIYLNGRNAYFAHALPIILEIMCLVSVGIYGQFFYKETLTETEALLCLMLFAMGLQNGLTASISNFAVKTTHLTGITTDLGILFSMFTMKKFRENEMLVGKAKLLLSIVLAYVLGAVFSGMIYFEIKFKVFYVVSFFLILVIAYDFSKIRLLRYLALNRAKEPVLRTQKSEARSVRQEEEISVV